MKRQLALGAALLLLVGLLTASTAGALGVTPMFDAPPSVRPTRSIM